MRRRLDAMAARLQPFLIRVEPLARRWIGTARWALVLVPAIWMVAQVVLGQLGANPIEMLQRESGEWTLRLLAASLAVTPLMRITRWGWLVRERRFLGLSAFCYAFGHLSIYVGLDMFFDVGDIVNDVLKHRYVTVGMLAFVLLIPLAITSTRDWIKRLGGKRWNRLHRLVYVSAVAGCIHYLWAVKKDIEEPLLYSSIFAALFVLRFLWRRGTTKPKAGGRGAPHGASAPAA